MNSYNILVVEDEKEIADAIEIYLLNQGYNVFKGYNGLEGLKVIENQEIHLAIVDIMMPKMDGITLTMKLRENYNFPVIMLSAKSEEVDKIMGLNIGADDYVTKPFSPLTLMARMKALYRRSQIPATEHHIIADETPFDVMTHSVKINTVTREAYYHDQLIENLTPKEFDLLLTFVKSPKRVFNREQLLKQLWEDPFYGDERTVDAHIKKLRQKIEVVGPQIIQTVWGVGYKYEDPGEH